MKNFLVGNALDIIKDGAVDTLDSVKDGTRLAMNAAQKGTAKFHDKYVSKITPDFGKYGKQAEFIAGLAPGVDEYNALREGDWKGLAISAGIDAAAIGVAIATAGTGYAGAKGGMKAAKAGAKVAVNKATKEVAQATTKKVIKEVSEKTTEKVVKEAGEEISEKIIKEVAEEIPKKVEKDVVEEISEKTVKKSYEKILREKAKKIDKGEVIIKKKVEELDKGERIFRNKIEGCAREEVAQKELSKVFGEKNVLRERTIKDINGKAIIDSVTNEARKLDFAVVENGVVKKAYEITSKTASKVEQMAKEQRIIDEAIKGSGAFIFDCMGNRYSIPEELLRESEGIKGVVSKIWRI